VPQAVLANGRCAYRNGSDAKRELRREVGRLQPATARGHAFVERRRARGSARVQVPRCLECVAQREAVGHDPGVLETGTLEHDGQVEAVVPAEVAGLHVGRGEAAGYGRDADEQPASGAEMPQPARDCRPVVLDVLEDFERADGIERFGWFVRLRVDAEHGPGVADSLRGDGMGLAVGLETDVLTAACKQRTRGAEPGADLEHRSRTGRQESPDRVESQPCVERKRRRQGHRAY
jgi:hypothetical protein